VEVAGAIFGYLWKALSATGLQLLLVLGPGLALALALHYLAGFVQRRAYAGLGRTLYLVLFGWLGTSLHELGHALFCLIFGHKIVEMRLFDPDPQTGVLGYVKHSFNPRNPYQVVGNFFIGVGPILLGTAVTSLLARLLLGAEFLNPPGGLSLAAGFGSWEMFGHLAGNIWLSTRGILEGLLSWQSLAQWQTWLFVYLVFAIGSSLTLSPSDLKGALGGFGVLIGLWLLFNLVTVWAGDFASGLTAFVAGYGAFFYALMLLALLVNLAAAVVILVPLYFISKIFRRGS
jgi:hypothetical protein